MTLVSRRNVKHAQVAARLRARPGVEMPVGVYVDATSARVMARNVRDGGLPAYQPAGTFEARIAPSPNRDGCVLHARYIGETL